MRTGPPTWVLNVALIMVLMEAKNVAHGPLEALSMVDEEDGFTRIEASNGGSGRA